MAAKPVIVTTSWDDGGPIDKKLSHLLQDYAIKATFYVTRDIVEKSSCRQLIKELDENFEIGAHTLSHPVLSSLCPENAMAEIKGSKDYLEELLHHRVGMFSYPKGMYNDQTVELVKRAGFIGARTTDFQIDISQNPFLLGVGPQASNGSPLLRLKISLKSRLSISSLMDWNVNAKSLFDHLLKKGGIWHLWGHSWEIENNRDWKKLEDVLEYVSNRENVSYFENGQILKLVDLNGRVPA